MSEPKDLNSTLSGSGRSFLILAALVIIVAGIKAAQAIMVPFLLAVFLATIAATPMLWIKRRGVPSGLALTLVVLGIFLALALLATLLTQSTSAFSAKLPFYQERLILIQSNLAGLLGGLGIPVDLSSLADSLSLSSVLAFAGSTLSSLGNVLGDGFLILLTVIFILAEVTSFSPKLHAILANPDRDVAHFERIADNINRYIAIKTSVSIATGITVTTFLWILGVDFPVLWGLLALLLNFVPTVGSIFAAIPPIILALIQLGPSEAGLVGLGFFFVNTVFGNVIEPRYMGRGLGLSTLVVFLSLIFWGWVLGPVGMFLSVPLTMTGKIALEANPRTLWLAKLLGPGSESIKLEPAASSDTEPT